MLAPPSGKRLWWLLLSVFTRAKCNTSYFQLQQSQLSHCLPSLDIISAIKGEVNETGVRINLATIV